MDDLGNIESLVGERPNDGTVPEGDYVSPETVLEEAVTYHQMVRRVTPKTKKRSRIVRITSFENTGQGNLKFTTRSVSNKNLRYEQTIKLADWERISKDRKFGEWEKLDKPTRVRLFTEKIRKAIYGNLKVECNCPDFLFGGYAYILEKEDALCTNPRWDKVLRRETGTLEPIEKFFPKVKNPELRGVCCKHLNHILMQLPFWAQRIAESLGSFRTKSSGIKIVKKTTPALRKSVKGQKLPTKQVPPMINTEKEKETEK